MTNRSYRRLRRERYFVSHGFHSAVSALVTMTIAEKTQAGFVPPCTCPCAIPSGTPLLWQPVYDAEGPKEGDSLLKAMLAA